MRWHRNRRDEGPLVDVPLRDNWYQSSSYWPSSFALITTVAEDGTTNVAPYQLSFPFEVIGGRSVLLISRQHSNTDRHLKRTGVCALNYVEFDKRSASKIVGLGFPGQSTAEKMKDNPYTLVDSPTPGRAFDGDRFPHILEEAFQVYECHVDTAQPIHDNGRTPEYFVLTIDRILMRQSWADNLGDAATRMPRMPITFGFRGGTQFWFAELKKPFWVSTPTDKGPKEEAILYEANRIDPTISFTRDACKELTGIPRPFVKTALKGIVKRATEEGVTTVDVEFVQRINAERRG